MSAFWLWARHDIRRRWRSILTLAVVTAIAGGVAMTAITGARRSAVVVAETMNERGQPDVISLTAIPDFDWRPIVRLPYVEDYSVFAATPLCVRETGGLGWTFGSESALCEQPPIEGGGYETIARMDMLEGRIPTGPHEAAVNRLAQEQRGVEVGDRLHVEGVRPGRLQEYWAGEPRGTHPWGPTFGVRVTGIFTGADDFWRIMSGGNGQPGVALSRSFFPTFGDRLGYLPQAYLRFSGGEADIPRYVEDVTRITGDPAFPVRNIHDGRRLVERSTRVEATALLVFAAALIAAALVLIGQAVARAIRSASDEAATLRALGLAPRGVVLGLATPGLMVGLAGAAGAAIVAVVSSPAVPIGLSRSFELDRGINADVPVVVVGAAAIMLVVGLVSTVTAAMAAGRARARRGRPTGTGRSIGRLPLPTTVALGARMALQRRAGNESVPLRPALAGATVAVTAVVAALTVGHAVDETVERPSRAGEVWDAAYYKQTNERAITGDPDIVRASRVSRAIVSVDGLPTPAYAPRPVGRPLDHVIIDGRLPQRPDEVALGPSTASAVGAGVGDNLPAGASGESPVRVVGTVLLWEDPGAAAYDEGILLSPPALRRLEPSTIDWRTYFVDVRGGADLVALDRRMEAAGGRRDQYWPSLPPAAIDNLQTTRGLPMLLAVLLAALGVGTVGHMLVATIRHRRRDLAILRALGLSGRGARAAIAWQATIVAAVSLVVGVPLGIVGGYLSWRLIATSLPIVHVSPGVALTVALILPAALATANLAALWPARVAARTSPAEVLRAE